MGASTSKSPSPAVEFQHALRDDRSLSATAKLVGYTLCARYPDIRPSVATLAADAGLSSRTTVRKALRELEDGGWVKVSRSTTEHGDQDNNTYMITVPEGVGQQMTHGGLADDPRVGHQMTPKSQVKVQAKNQSQDSRKIMTRTTPAG